MLNNLLELTVNNLAGSCIVDTKTVNVSVSLTEITGSLYLSEIDNKSLNITLNILTGKSSMNFYNIDYATDDISVFIGLLIAKLQAILTEIGTI